jgi:predicted DNA-binding transcriptional regulator AlpA
MSTPAEFITSSQVRARYGGRSRMWLHRKLLADPTFPKPIHLGTSWRYWRLSDLERYEREAASR